jgi:hypothetical protein
MIIDLNRVHEDVARGDPAQLLQTIDPEKRLRQEQRRIINNTREGCRFHFHGFDGYVAPARRPRRRYWQIFALLPLELNPLIAAVCAAVGIGSRP